jgi:NADPH:quinone reductase-like Zn-dependent oxidoreductase
MKAAVYHVYGAPDVVHVVEVPKPSPKPQEVLVKVLSVAITAADVRIRSAQFPKGFGFFARLAFGLFAPRKSILGSCFSGVIEAVGSEVTQYKVGDDVCGINTAGFGMHAEYGVMKEHGPIVKKPQNVSHDDAAAVIFGGLASLSFLRDRAKIQKGDRVMVNGAAGALGTNAVQLARHFGATVTTVTRTETVGEAGPYDIVFDTVGNLSPSDASRLLALNGSLILAAAGLGEMLTMDKRIITGIATENVEDIRLLLSLIERGELQPVVDSVYPLEKIVEAYQRAESRQKRGTIIIHPY